MKAVLPKPAAANSRKMRSRLPPQTKPPFFRLGGGRNDNLLPLGHKKGVVGKTSGKLEEFSKVFHAFSRYIE